MIFFLFAFFTDHCWGEHTNWAKWLDYCVDVVSDSKARTKSFMSLVQ
jgi:hypothetical protein